MARRAATARTDCLSGTTDFRKFIITGELWEFVHGVLDLVVRGLPIRPRRAIFELLARDREQTVRR
jgi:hypothetical protein